MLLCVFVSSPHLGLKVVCKLSSEVMLACRKLLLTSPRLTDSLGASLRHICYKQPCSAACSNTVSFCRAAHWTLLLKSLPSLHQRIDWIDCAPLTIGGLCRQACNKAAIGAGVLPSPSLLVSACTGKWASQQVHESAEHAVQVSCMQGALGCKRQATCACPQIPAGGKGQPGFTGAPMPACCGRDSRPDAELHVRCVPAAGQPPLHHCGWMPVRAAR